MAKKTKKLLITTTLLLTLFIFSSYVALTPNARAALFVTGSTAKGLTIIDQVAGFNLTQYNATPTLKTEGPSLGTLTTENIRYTLRNANSNVEILEKFTNGHLQIIDVLENSNPFQITHSPTAVVWRAKTFLLNYQTYSANSFYGQLSSMLNKVDSTKNSTTTSGNIKFDITTTSGMGNSTTFTWSYTSNGITATGKCVSLEYRAGLLKAFIDTWNLYKIGSTTVNLSEKQAEEIAMENARTFTWSIGSGNQTFVINNFNVTKPIVKQLMFCEAGNASNARDSDQLALYPMWRIGVGLDKYYPGNVYGIYVDIWADTGQVKGIHEVFSTLPAPTGETATITGSSITSQSSSTEVQQNSFPITRLVFASLAVIAIVFPVWLIRKKVSLHSLRLPKVRKISATLLCVLIGLVAFISLASAVSTVNAACAVVWGETSSGAPPSLFHTGSEIYVQQQLSGNISSWFDSAGYADYNYEANDQTTKNNVLNYTGYYGQCYPSVETVYFDHGIGMAGGDGLSNPYDNEWHYMLCTDESIYNVSTYNVFDYQLYSATSTENHYFSYISTCHSASLYNGNSTLHDGIHFFNATGTYGANQGGSGNIIGMPYAWTHGASLSTNGFVNPDTGPFCYIGFVEGSAALCQDVDNRQSGTTTYGTFVYLFFDSLLNLELTVNDALDYAAYQAFPPEGFHATALYNGFLSVWPEYGGGEGTGWGKMVVYGNGDIYIYPGGPDYVTTPSISGPTSGYINTAYQFSASATDPYDYQLWYTINWGDGSDPTVTNYPVNISHTWTSVGPKTITVTAESQNGIASAPGYHIVTISNPQPVNYTLTVDAYGIYGYTLDPNVYIDDIDHGAAPISIQMTEGYHSVSLDTYVWDPYLCCYASFYIMYDDTYTQYYNGDPVPIYSDTSIVAVYVPS